MVIAKLCLHHQYGLVGDKNASFKNSELVTNYGYLLEYCPGHPYPHDRSNQTTRVLQHRLVVERNSDRFDETERKGGFGHTGEK